jgi:hypothetical protein
LEGFLYELSPKLLQQMIVDSELNIKSTSKATIVRHLVEMTDYKPAARNLPPPRPKRKTQPQKKKIVGKENKRKPRNISNIELDFTSDDSVEFNPKLAPKEIELSIDSADDAERHPPVLFQSEQSFDDTSSDPDFSEDSRERPVSRKRRSRHHRSSKRRHHRKREYYSSDDDSYDRKRKRHHRSSKRKHRKHHSDEDESEEKQRKKRQHKQDDEKTSKSKTDDFWEESSIKDKSPEENSPPDDKTTSKKDKKTKSQNSEGEEIIPKTIEKKTYR